jgi:hypothetical protein
VIVTGRHVVTKISGWQGAAIDTGDAGVRVPVVVHFLVRFLVFLARELPLLHCRPSFRMVTDHNLPIRTI